MGELLPQKPLTSEQIRAEFAYRASRLWFLSGGREQTTVQALQEFDEWIRLGAR